MKKCIDSVMYAGLLLWVLGLTSCQKEHETVDPIDEQEVFMAGSELAKLIEQTVSNDGSFDNIVDGASCFYVQFPYSVKANGVEIAINSEEDLEQIEIIFDVDDDEEDVLDISFPITLVMADYTEVSISSGEELSMLAAECVEDGKDDDIECIDFVYPIDLYMFEMNNERMGNVTVSSDMDWRRFFVGLRDDELVSIGFPIEMQQYDSTMVTVNDNNELRLAIEEVQHACNEDDNADYADDDFTVESLREFLLECPFLVDIVQRDEFDTSEQYLEYAMVFAEDGQVTVIDPLGISVTGTWAAHVVDYRVLLNLEFDALVDFNLEWLVNDLNDGRIKLYSGHSNKIVLRSSCHLFDEEPDHLREVLSACGWMVKAIENDGEEIGALLGHGLHFRSDGVATLGFGDQANEGEWAVTANAQGRLVMAIAMAQEPAIAFEWPLMDQKEEMLRFAIPGLGHELILGRNCDDDSADEEVLMVRSLFSDSFWEVARFEENDDSSTEHYTGFSFGFGANGLISVINGNAQEVDTGRWLVYRNSENNLEMIISFDAHSRFYALSNDYLINGATQDRLDLGHVNRPDGLDRLIWERR